MLKFRPGDEDTICALATAPGIGAIAIVRVSGRDAFAVSRRIARFLPEDIESHKAYFGTLHGSQGALDEALVTCFAEGRSFTGEESVEFSVHGGTQISGKLVEELLSCGSRLAKAGEFTYRAYLNDRIDLVQAESILSLIEARSGEGSSNALLQLKGELSRLFLKIEEDLVWIGAHIEASIDFSSEGIELKTAPELLERSSRLRDTVVGLLSSYGKGRMLRDGLTVALVGAPNAGKSSLLNAVVKEDRAIVTDQPGTTRDLIEVETRLDGTPVRWVDTAGLRDAVDEAEKQGVARSKKAIETSDFVVVVMDLLGAEWRTSFENFVTEGRQFPRRQQWYVFNKVDLDSKGQAMAAAQSEAKRLGVVERVLFVSAIQGRGIEEFQSAVLAPLREKAFVHGGVSITQARHVEGLQVILESLDRAIQLMKQDASPELVALEVSAGVRTIHELLGKVFHEQVIDRIFKEFCLGK